MKIEDIAVDTKLVEEGAWVSDIPELEGVRLKCRGSDNKDWRRMSQHLVNAVPRKKRIPLLDPAEQDRINAIVVRECGLLDWEGIEDNDGNPVLYSKKKAEEYLQVKKFRDGALYACFQVSEGLVDEVETLAGN
ncbi:hypothetical protein [Bradyrhizobium elkanii]|uniref:hypothetical protein n=1 Tax=Bradyrhizobium elkanii TaxID=29448 RepID=UPI00272DB415|nr:hypothetical protein [Bradyrhizobium elkanii]WLA80281.1 hypothetical protein QNJ99_33585 [Bradyrhizobium elkanii]